MILPLPQIVKKTLLYLAFLGSTILSAQSDDINRVNEIDLENSLRELADLRRKIESEKIPLANAQRKLENTAAERRKEADRVKRLRDNQVIDLDFHRDLIARLKGTNSFLSRSLGEHIRTFESHIHVGERLLYQDRLNKARAAEDDFEIAEDQKLRAQLNAVDAALERLERSFGGDSFQGSAIMPNGNYEEGTFVIVGPISFFTSKSGKTGLPALDLTSENAIIHSISDDFAEGITQLSNTKEGIVPIDATLGDAFKIAATHETQVEEIKKGGLVMYPILGLATFALIVAIFKWFEISNVKEARSQDLHIILQHIRAGDSEMAMAHAKSVKGMVGEMLVAAVENAEADPDLIEEVLYEKMLATQPKLERMLPLIAVTAATAPLFGLLGTVTGMIKTFNLITVFGTNDASNLSAGISEALVTTKFGLIIAIPALIMYAVLSRKAKGVIGSMEKTAIGFLNGLRQ